MADETRRVLDPDVVTRRVGEEMPTDATRRVSEPTTVRAATGGEERHPLGAPAPGTVICDDYRVERTLRAHESSRPGLFLCHGPEGLVVVKVAALLYPPKSDLWQRLATLEHPHVIRTYRTFERDGFYYEIQEYCPCGTLEDWVPRTGSGVPPVTAEWISRVMLPQLQAAMKYLHEHDVIHRDIKPANIYLKGQPGQESLVLADFDISAVLEQTRTSRDTQRVAGTWIYTAPEAFPRFVDDHASSRRGRVTRSSDYYSLGITIIELLLGTTSLHLCQLPDLFDFYLQGGRVEIPQGIHGQLAMLLRGLLIRNRQTRWGAAEVDRWLSGHNSDDDYKRIQDDDYFELARASRPYRLKDRSAVDLPGLAEAMYREPEVATEDLITGDILLNWIGGLDPSVAREIRRDRDRLYLHPAMVLQCAIMRCDPTRPFVFSDGFEVMTTEDWITHAIQLQARSNQPPDAFATVPLLQELEVWLRLKQEPRHALADAVAEIQQSPARVRLEELAFLFQPTRPFYVTRELAATTPKELVRLAYGDAKEWNGGKRPRCYEAVYQRWFDGALSAWLRQRGLGALAAQCDEVRAKLPEHPFAAFETVLRLLDPAMPPVHLELDAGELQRECLVPFGKSRTCTLRYTARGPGIPFAAVTVSDGDGVLLPDRVIQQREGVITVTVDTQQNVAAGKLYQARIGLDSGFTHAPQMPLKFSYRVIYPPEATLRRVLAGAAIGAVILAAPRFIFALACHPAPVEWSELDLSTLWSNIVNLYYPLTAYLSAFAGLLGALYWGLRIWLLALRRSSL